MSANRVAFITGGAAGIGRAIAEVLARNSFNIVVVDVDAAGGERSAKDLRGLGIGAWSIPADLCDTDAASGLVARAIAAAGRVDVLVNNAGMIAAAPFLDYPVDLWRRVLALNLTTPMLLAQAAVADMASRGWGRIINMSSISAFCANDGRTGYASTKTALTALTRQMALEFGPLGIRANAIAPGPTVTAIIADVMEAAASLYLPRSPLGRFGQPEEIASIASFLVSDDADRVNGQTIIADGGFLVTGLVDCRIAHRSLAKAS